jgi:phosphinothricin acetyltransferase
MDYSIRPAIVGDAEQIAAIYNYFIADTVVTFETEQVDAAEIANRLGETIAIPLPWLVAEQRGKVLGYAYASKWKGRCAYRFAVEATIYLDIEHTGKGIGLPLYTALIDAIRAHSMRTVIGGISLPNDASVHLHERLGFRKVGHFERVGFKQDRWVDVGYWQLQL